MQAPKFTPTQPSRRMRGAAVFVAALFATRIIAAPLSVGGVENFEKIDDHVYRGAQPTEEGFRNLAKLGVKTVMDLREADERTKAEEAAVKAAGMQFISIPMHGMETPLNESVMAALNLLEDRTTGPVFVHCKRGADRTGGIIACYRVEHDHWENGKALAEARSMGMSRWQTAIQHYVLKYKSRLFDAAPAAIATAAVASAAAATQ